MGDYRDQAAEAFLARRRELAVSPVPVVLDGMEKRSRYMVPAALAAFFVALLCRTWRTPKRFRDQLVSDFSATRWVTSLRWPRLTIRHYHPLKRRLAEGPEILAVTAAKDKVLAGEGAIIRRGQAAEVDFWAQVTDFSP